VSITFQNEADIILWTLAMLLVTFEEQQYLFAAQCIWWIAALVQLDPALKYLINHRKFPSDITRVNAERESIRPSIERGISSTPRDIQRYSKLNKNTELVENQYQADPLQRTRKGRVNPLPKTKKKLRAERNQQLRVMKRRQGIDSQYMHCQY